MRFLPTRIHGVIDYLFVRNKSSVGPSEDPLPSFSLRAAAPFALANTIGAVYQRSEAWRRERIREVKSADASALSDSGAQDDHRDA